MNEPGRFEDAMERLEEIVAQMESGDLPLEEILDRYEEGTRLVRHCTAQLSAAEKRIELIAQNAAGEPEVKPFDPDAEAPGDDVAPVPAKARPRRSPKAAAPPPEEEPGDVSLF